jgi:hypothetical protein
MPYVVAGRAHPLTGGADAMATMRAIDAMQAAAGSAYSGSAKA